MSLFGAMQSGISGLSAQSTAMGAISDNISNVNTVGYKNTGVSFSMFNNGGMLGIILLSAFAIGVVIFLIYWLKNEKNRLTQVSLGFIIGGALGNVIDRLRFGAVYDFLDFYYKNWHWPAFNLADTFICIGALIIIVYGVWYPKCNLKKKG